jgi:hypothetical protein
VIRDERAVAGDLEGATQRLRDLADTNLAVRLQRIANSCRPTAPLAAELLAGKTSPYR